jgi:Cu(I)/Ag(I) efflux system membrane fusion protein
MNTNSVINTIFSRFALRGVTGLSLLAAGVIVAFFLGGLFLGGGEAPAPGDPAGHEHAAESPAGPSVWTCSMHPQIKLPKPGKCPICYMDLIPLETGADDDLGPRQLRLSETAKQLARIETTPATRAFAQADVRMVGKIEYDETNLAYITAWVPGRLDRLYADFTGITVAKGDHMVYMYSPELLAAQEELLQAHAAVKAMAKTSSNTLRSTAQTTLDATRGKLRLFGLTDKQIENIEGSGEKTDHLTIYAPIGGVVVHKDAKEGMYVTTGTRIYTIADLSKLWVMFEAYESDLPWLRYGQRVKFTSPAFPGEVSDGVISFIDPVVSPKTRTVRVRAIVDNKNRKLKPDMFVRGVVKSRIDGNGNVVDDYLAGKWISPMHPEIVKNGPGKCDVCGMDLVPAETLGFAGKAVSDTDAPLLIPDSAPLLTGTRAVVYVEIPNGEGPLFEGREVELGPRAGEFYVVKSGIEEGELVVTNGAFKIDSELQIQAKPSMMSLEGGGTAAGHQHDRAATANPSMPMTSAPAISSTRVREALTPVYTSYFDVQMALAKDDLDMAKRAGAALAKAVGRMDKSVFSREGHEHWMRLSKRIDEGSQKISKAQDLVLARDGFYDLSRAVIELHDGFGHAAGEANFFLTFCPMARDGKGAYWLQTVDVVWNSFYGETMLRCGEIKQTLAPNPNGAQSGAQ